MKLFSSIRNFFFVRYVKFIEFVTLLMIARTGNLVRKLLVLKGKDPDYVPPPAPPKAEDKYSVFDPMKAQVTLSNFYSAKRPAWNTGAQDAWVRNPKLHPVLAARKQFEEGPPPVEESSESPEILQVAANQEESSNE